MMLLKWFSDQLQFLAETKLYYSIPNISSAESNISAFIRFYKIEKAHDTVYSDQWDVHTRTKARYSGPWTDHGELTMTERNWPKSMKDDTTDIPTPNLKPSRVLPIRNQKIPHIRIDARGWWNEIAPLYIATQEAERSKKRLRIE